MKYKDYKFTSSNESMNLTYDQACMYFEETLDFIEKSNLIYLMTMKNYL